MIDVNDKKVIQFFSSIHESAVKKMAQIQQKNSETNEDIIRVNRLFKLLCLDSALAPYQYAEQMNEIYEYDLRGNDIVQIFRNRRISFQEKRKELLKWAHELADAFGKALNNGKKEDFQRFLEKREDKVLNEQGEHYKIQERVGCMMIFAQYENIDINEDIKLVEQMGNIYARYFLYDISDALAEYCGAQKKPSSKKTVDNKANAEEYTYRIERLESELERTDMMLKDLQVEFEERIEESKTKELAEFFSRLNSEKYGCILDELLNVKKGVNLLKKNHYEIPPEIGGLLIMTQKLIQFVRDSNINPIMKLHEEKIVKFSDIESCDYEGTPFNSNDDEKIIKVISPGWIYTEKGLQIARPKVKEII